jgi:hypothetical protein
LIHRGLSSKKIDIYAKWLNDSKLMNPNCANISIKIETIISKRMLSEKYISENPQAKVLVLFGGSPVRRDEIIRHLIRIPSLSIIGTLSEEEGLQTIIDMPQVDIVLIGGRYSLEQRTRIKQFLRTKYSYIKTTELLLQSVFKNWLNS